ncbi:hypothetical protein SAMN02745166_01752 [Prosthecobacter debontii]|uniref:Uncharacterized protein n=1 Tax=Prosthecobacter debontii TaxID=48467 RepID=A0A1T4XMS9_9BACT|nr:hypothetical protein SAMN02745166_01752 [Prosthecobacter debontii]
MFDAEVNHQLLAEIRHVRVILSRWIIFQVVLGALCSWQCLLLRP